jgi:hypothetical protein
MTEFGDLVSAIGDMSPSSSVRFRQGEITAVGLDTVSVDIGASGEPVDDIAFMSSYSPTVGDVVWLITDGQDWFVLGQLGQDFTVESLRLRGLDNLGLTGGKFTLQGGVSRPQASPVATTTWPNKPTGWFSNRGYNPRGWFYDSGFWYSTESLFGGGWKQYSEATETFRKTKSVSLPSDENPTGGIAVISGKAYVLVQDFNRLNGIYARWYVYRYSVSTGAKEAEFQYLPSGTTAVEAYGYRPAIGVKGTNLIIGQARQSDNKIEIREYTTTGTVVGSTIVTNLAAGQPIHHISYGSYDFGGPRFVVYANTWNEIKVLSTTGVYSASESFPTPLKQTDVDGIGWDSVDGTFVSTRAEVIYRHSKHAWTATADDTWWVAHSWFDSNSAGTGQHETLISDTVSFPMTKRAALTVTTPALPAPSDPPSDDDVTGVRIYHGRGATTPTAANMKREVTDLADGVVSVTYTNLTPVNAANTGVPSAFPGQTPFEITSPDNEIVLKGDGEAQFTKLVTLKDKATNTEWLNTAGTGRLQKPVILIANRNTTALSTANSAAVYYTASHHNIVLNQSGFTRDARRYYVPLDGVYRVYIRAGFAANSSGRRLITIHYNGLDISSLNIQTVTTGRWVADLTHYQVVTGAPNSYFEFMVEQNSGGTLATETGVQVGGQIIIERISD